MQAGIQSRLFDIVVRKDLQQGSLVAQMVNLVRNNSVSPAQVDLSVERSVVPVIRLHEADAECVPQGYKEFAAKRSYLAVQLERSPAAKKLDACFMKSQHLSSHWQQESLGREVAISMTNAEYKR